MENDSIGNEPLISVGVEVKQSDGNYGSVSGHLIVSKVQVTISQQELDDLLNVSEGIFQQMRERLARNFTITIPATGEPPTISGVTVEPDDIPFEEPTGGYYNEPPAGTEAELAARPPFREAVGMAPQGAQKPASRPVDSAAVLCPRCGGPTWDNRQNKRNPKAPDFKCRDKECIDDKGFATSGWIDKKDPSLIQWAGMQL